MPYTTIFFDLDGTLLNTLDDLADSMNQVLQDNNHPPHPVQAYRYFVGQGMESLVRQALPPEARSSDHVQRCLREMQDTYARNWAKTTTPYPGIEPMLQELHARGVRLNIVSNKPQPNTDEAVAHFFNPELFDTIVGAREGIPKKPDPTVVLELMRSFGAPKEHCVFVGDSAVDARTGRAAAIFTVGVLWGFRDAPELTENGAQELIKAPHQFIDLIDKAG